MDNPTAAQCRSDTLSLMHAPSHPSPGLPRVWRGPHTLQLGTDPTRAVLIDLPDPRAAELLDLLDGTRPSGSC